MNEFLEKVREGNFRAIARVITLIENRDDTAAATIAALYGDSGQAHIIGITGPPGAGKSTLVNEIAKSFASEGRRVAIIAVDPSSPFSGGALLGDRVRMQDLLGERGIFIRSMASRGNLGGLASSTAAVVNVFDAAQFETILVETVGAGQAEVDIADNAHTTVVVEAPGMGDEVQTIKAGILEIADILVVNKADRSGALRTVKALEMMVHMGRSSDRGHHRQLNQITETSELDFADEWQTPVLQTVANEGKGIEDLCKQIRAHHSHLKGTGEWTEREKKRSRKQLARLLQERFMARLAEAIPEALREDLVMAVVRRELDPYSAADQLFERYSQ